MKNLSLIFFVAAAVLCVPGVLACCGKIKNSTIRNSGKWLIVTAVLKAICGFTALGDFAFALVFLAIGSVLINAVKCFLKFEGDDKN